MSRRRAVNRWSLVLGVIALALAGSAAYAAIPGSDGVIHACYKKSSPNQGTLRVVDAERGQACVGSEGRLDWNRTGPQGDTGPQGEPGLSGYEVVEGDPFTTSGGTVGVIATCPVEKKPIGGGFTSSNGDINLYGSYPSPTENGWRIDVNFGSSQMTVTPHAVCAAVAD